MALPPGARLGPYEILSPLGAGGMGEVYRARDPRLGREVAVKVLTSDTAISTDRLRRFEDEARAAGALNHANILSVFDVGTEASSPYVVFELLEGETLRERMQRGRIPARKAVEHAVQICQGLAAAHAKGIVHRDLKPENLFLTNDGRVKILDFGLAKLIQGPDLGSAPDGTRTATQPGTLLGTLAYMSPEQARGGAADARSDIFAFGAVLYEMLSGRPAFRGPTAADTLSAILNSDPPPITSAAGPLPPSLEPVVRRCLEKDPEERFQSPRDLGFALSALSGSGVSGAPSTASVAERRKRRRWWLAAALAGALLLAVVVWLRWRPREPELAPPKLVPLTSMRGDKTQPTFSPDGGQIAFTWDGEKRDNWDIYLKMIGSSEIHRLTTDPAPDFAPSWSPGGRQIAFIRSQPGDVPWYQKGQGTIHLVSPVGGSDRKLSDFPVFSTLSWSPDGRWLAAARYPSATETDPGAAGIYLIPVLGGEPRPMTSAKAPACHLKPAFSLDGHHLAYVSRASCSMGISCHIDVVELGADYMPAGPPHRLTRRPGWIVGLAWSRDGNSVIYSDWTTGWLQRVWIVGDRPPERIELAGPTNTFAPATAVSLDRLAFAHGRVTSAIYRFEMGHPPEALLGSSLHDYSPQLSPDGRRITFESRRGGEESEIWLAAADGSNPMQLTHGPGIWQGTPRWSPDGQRIAFDSQTEDGKWDIWTIDADGGSPRRLTLDPGNKKMPSWSRDGHWIYFQSDRAGGVEVWRIPGTGGSEARVTHGGGSVAYESADGKTLFFTRPSDADGPLFALPLAGGPERKVLECVPDFAVGPGGVYHLGCTADQRVVPLYLLDPATGQDRLLGTLEKADSLTVSPDGKTILYTQSENQGADLMMIENFR